MIVPSDEDYKQTKLVKVGKQHLLPPFKELADWIGESFEGVRPLNIYYDKIDPDNRPRLSVIFECDRDVQEFRDYHGNFNSDHQTKIASKFRSIVADQRNDRFETDKLFVIFCAFEPVARVEANWSITKEQIAQIKKELDSATIWTIRPGWADVAFFFYTDAQMKDSENSGLRNLCIGAYSKILSAYDQFGYFQKRPIAVSFDSKENFDTQYGGSWFNYDRR